MEKQRKPRTGHRNHGERKVVVLHDGQYLRLTMSESIKLREKLLEAELALINRKEPT